MKRHRYYLAASLTLWAVTIVLANFWLQRADAVNLVILFTLAWLGFGFAYAVVKFNRWLKPALIAAIGIRVVLLFSFPNLTDDFYRYLWDGLQTVEGSNPYQHKPIDIETKVNRSDLYDELNSQEFYTVYPPVSQMVFAAAVWFGGKDLLWSTFFLKVFILLFEGLSVWLLIQLLAHYGRPREWVLWYALNPLVITELTGNIHFEAAMIAFSLLAVWLFINKQELLTGVALALAIGTKLWPVLFVPFFLKARFNWRTAVRLPIGLALTLVAFFALFQTPDLLQNVSSSIKLYFSYFEFNSSIYYLTRFVTVRAAGYQAFLTISGFFNIFLLASLIILWIFLKRSAHYLPQAMLFSLGLYLAMATTVHPWYITPLIAFAVVTRYRFAMLWSVLIPLTYLAYRTDPAQELFWLIAIIYALVYGCLFVEVFQFKALIRKQYLKRAHIKFKRIRPHIAPQSKVLDVGAGNGALALLLQQAGHQVSSIDVGDKTYFEEVKPIIYNGCNIPFEDNSFDTVQLITVLHHTADPEQVLKEAIRTGKQVIVMEDIFTSSFQKYLTWFTDSLVNAEFLGHPHTNKTDTEWKTLFNKLGMQVVFEEQYRFLLFFRQVTYVLRPV